MKTTAPAHLPSAVRTYFAAANRSDAARAAACFTADALVRDESHDFVGQPAIRAWIVAAGRTYRPRFTVMRSSMQSDQISLAVAVAGQFPGSPVTLDYELRLRGGKISSLTIE